MKQKEQPGTLILELTHDGIPDSELKPEEFDERQLTALEALPPDMQAAVRKGYPIKVLDAETGENIMSFNLKNVVLSEYQKETLAKSLLDAMCRYMADPENAAKIEKRAEEIRRKNGDK